MADPEYDCYEDSDERKIADAIADVNERLDELQNNGDDDDIDADSETLWPSLVPKKED